MVLTKVRGIMSKQWRISAGCRRVAPGLVVFFLLTGCSSYSTRVTDVRKLLAQGELDAALEKAEATQAGSSEVLFLMEKGLILHYAGRFEESNAAFERAELLIDDLYTKSLTKELGAFITSDNVRDYDGEEFERVWINYYRALNYIHLGMRDEALVECRKVNQKLKRYADDKGSGETAYPEDPFIQYLTGLLYEWGGEVNDAFISYRIAEESYLRHAAAFGVEMPPDLPCSLLRTSKRLGFSDEYRQYSEKYPELSWEETYADSGYGALVILHENGYIPFKIEQNITVPIFESDHWDKDEEFAATLARRSNGYNSRNRKVKYWLRVALPQYAPGDPRIAYGRVSAGGEQSHTVTVEDLGAIARRTFEEKYGTILLRSMVRALTKYGAHEFVDKKSEALGILSNIVAVATESADTRSWLTLPSALGLARLSLPAGEHNVELVFYDQNGLEVQRGTIPGVEVRSGDVTFINYRTFD